MVKFKFNAKVNICHFYSNQILEARQILIQGNHTSKYLLQSHLIREKKLSTMNSNTHFGYNHKRGSEEKFLHILTVLPQVQ